MLPSFLGIGAQKAGTTWLVNQLRQHPAVHIPRVKEVHYFDYLHPTVTMGPVRRRQRGMKKALLKRLGAWRRLLERRGRRAEVRRCRELEHDMFTDDWYRRMFSVVAREDLVRGEYTPAYGSLPAAGILHVRELLGPDLKLIYMVRDPLARSLSHIRMAAVRTPYTEAEFPGIWPELRAVVLDRSNVKAHLDNWTRTFREEQLLVVPMGWIKESPAKALRAVESHLGLAAYEGYRKTDDKAYTTAPFAIPEAVVDELREALAPQYAFIETAFGKPFLDEI